MKKMRNWMVGLAAVSLLAVGLAAVAGNGFGESAAWNSTSADSGDCGACEPQDSCVLEGRDADGDGIPNSEDPDWVCPQDGTGYGTGEGCGLNQVAGRPLDGSGLGSGCRSGMGHMPAGGPIRGCHS